MRNRIFLKYILSYALVLFLPILLLYFFFDGAIIRRYSEEMAANDSNMLTQLRDTLDNRFQQLFNLSYAIQNTSALNPRNIGDDIVARRNAIALLGTYNSITELPQTILVYRSGDDVCYTATTAITTEKLFGQQMVYAGHDHEDFLRTVDASDSIIVWPVDSVAQFGGQSTECLTVFISVGAGNVRPKQRTVFVIPAARILDPIRALYGEETAVMITDKEGNPVISTGTLSEDMTRTVSASDGNVAAGDLQEYDISSTASRIMGWKYTVFRPRSVLEGPLHGYRRRVILLMSLIFLLGGAVIWLVSWSHYKPIRELAEKARAYARGREAGNEMEQVEAVLESLSDESRFYRVSLENSTEGLRQNCLTRLLSDAGHARECLEEMRGYGAFTEPGAYCRVLALEKKSLPADYASSALLSEILSGSLEVTEALVCENPPDSDMLAVILQYARPSRGSEEEVLDFQNRLEQRIGQGLALGVSQSVPAEELAEACRQAVSACRMSLIRGKGPAVFYSDDIRSSVSLKDYPAQELEALQWHLLQGDADRAEQCLDAVAERLQTDPVPLEMARMVLNDTVNVTVRTLLSMRGRVNPDVSFSLLEELLSVDSARELMGRLRQLIRDAFASAAGDGEVEDSRSEAMKTYVREHCFSSEFSLQMAADHFGLTPSNLSHYFKNCTGMGLSEYVQEVRRNEACRLLADTDESIQEIGRRVGMPNVSSFIRSFKQQTGLTPGQYRAKHVRSSESAGR